MLTGVICDPDDPWRWCPLTISDKIRLWHVDPHHEVSGPLHFVNDKGGNRSRTQIPPSASKSSKIKDPNSSICIQAASPSRAWYLPTSWGPGAVSCLQQKPGSTNVYKLLARAAPGIADWQFDLGHLLNWPTTSKHILNSEAKSGVSLRLRGPCARVDADLTKIIPPQSQYLPGLEMLPRSAPYAETMGDDLESEASVLRAHFPRCWLHLKQHTQSL